MKFRFKKNAGLLFGVLIYAETSNDFGIEIHVFKWTITLERV
jgi:hypothetical protein